MTHPVFFLPPLQSSGDRTWLLATSGNYRSKRARSGTRCKQAFTLVELLVVTAIIGVLAAMLFPVFTSVMNKNKSAICVQQEHSIYVAMALYTQDNNGHLVMNGNDYTTRWPLMISRYMPTGVFSSSSDIYYNGGKEFLKCPAAVSTALQPGSGAQGVYGYNQLITVGAATMPRTLASLPSLSHIVLLTCNSGAQGGGLGLYPYCPATTATSYGWKGNVNQNGCGPNHGSRCNFLFADGHVDSFDVTKANAYPWLKPNCLTLNPPL